VFRGSVKGTGYPLHSPVSPSLPLPASPCAITFQPDSTRRVVADVTDVPSVTLEDEKTLRSLEGTTRVRPSVTCLKA